MFDDDDQFERDDAAGLTPDQRELQGALRGLRPAVPAPVDRERLLFKAGVAVGQRSVSRWRAAAAILVAGNAGWLAATLATGGGGGGADNSTGGAREPGYVVQTAPTQPAPLREASPRVTFAWWPEQPPAAQAPRPSTGGTTDFLEMRDALLRQGLSALPKTSVNKGSRSEPLDVAELLGEPEDERPAKPAPAPWAPLQRLMSGEHL